MLGTVLLSTPLHNYIHNLSQVDHVLHIPQSGRCNSVPENIHDVMSIEPSRQLMTNNANIAGSRHNSTVQMQTVALTEYLSNGGS